MTKYMLKRFYWSSTSEDRDYEEWLQNFANEGWELVHTDFYLHIFKHDHLPQIVSWKVETEFPTPLDNL